MLSQLHTDFDPSNADIALLGPRFDTCPVKMLDLGDVVHDISGAGGDHFRRAEIAMRKILKSGA